MEPYSPVRINAEVEDGAKRPCSRWTLILRWFAKHTHLRLYYDIPFGRRSVEMQLAARDTFPESEWASSPNYTDALRLLKVLQREMNLPNHFLVRNDPLFLILTPDYDDFPEDSVRLGIREELGIDISREEFRQMYDVGDWTIGRFVSYVLSRGGRLGSETE